MLVRRFLLSGSVVLFLTTAFQANSQPVDASLDGKIGAYQFVGRAQKPWRLCVSLPHAKDHFYWDVVWGLLEQTREAGVQLGVYQAGGYEPSHMADQKAQIRSCIQDKADAVLIAAIDSEGLAAEEAELAAKGIATIDLTNDLDGAAVAAHSHHNFAETGRVAARYVLSIPASKPLLVGWFPGPDGPRWPTEFEKGIKEVFASVPAESRPDLIGAGSAPTDRDSQATLVRRFAANHKPDVIMANAIAAVDAARFYARKEERPKIVSLYMTDDVIEEMREGRIDAMVAFEPADQARIAVDLAVRVLEHLPHPYLVSVPLRTVTADHIDEYIERFRSDWPSARIPLPALPPPPGH